MTVTGLFGQIDPLYLFVFVGLFSPGPNVILITSSGARFGFRRTLPHLFGIVAGVGVTSGLTALGIGAALGNWPMLEWSLRVASAAWMLWMAFGLWTSRPGKAGNRSRPFTFVEAVLFQWINPKVWAVALAAVSAYATDLPPPQEVWRFASAFSGINLFVCLFWSYAGTLLAYLLSTPIAWRVFNRTMALALAVFSVSVLI